MIGSSRRGAPHADLCRVCAAVRDGDRDGRRRRLVARGVTGDGGQACARRCPSIVVFQLTLNGADTSSSAEVRAVDLELDAVDADVVRRSASIATAPDTVAPPAGAVMETVGGVGSAGSTTFENARGSRRSRDTSCGPRGPTSRSAYGSPRGRPRRCTSRRDVRSIFTGLVVDLEVNVVDTGEVSRRRVRDVGAATRRASLPRRAP